MTFKKSVPWVTATIKDVKNEKLFAVGILAIGIFIIGYGLINAPITNEAEIRRIYACDRLTRDYRDTDKYCHNPETAPEATKDTFNTLALGGTALVILGIIYLATIFKTQKPANL